MKITHIISVVGLMTAVTVPARAEEMTPGMWEITSSILSVDGPMVTPQVRAATLKQGQRIYKACLTAEQLKQAPLNVSSAFQGKCAPPVARMGNGKVTSSSACTLPNGSSIANSTGTYSAKFYRVETKSVTTIPQGNLKARSVVTGNYLGAC
jgi:hypothetical protein